VPGASAARALVTTGGLAPGDVVLLAPAGAAAVPVTAIAAAAQDDLHTAPDAQKQTGWTVQRRHQTEPVVLDGIVPARHTDAAPPSSARCRARRGHQAARRERPPPCPRSSARIGLYCTESSQAGQPRTAACGASPAMPATEVMAMASRAATTMSLMPAWSPCRVTRQHPPHRSASQHEMPRAAAWAFKTKSASSPSNRGGS